MALGSRRNTSRFADNVVVRIAGYNLGSVSTIHGMYKFGGDKKMAGKRLFTFGTKSTTVRFSNTETSLRRLCTSKNQYHRYHLLCRRLGSPRCRCTTSALCWQADVQRSLDVDDLLESFLNEYYGERPAQRIAKYIKLIETAFQTANHSVDFTGRLMDKLEARYTGTVRRQSRRTCPHLNCSS